MFYAKDEKDPSILHDIQWFNSLDQFYAHADMSNEATKNAIMGWTKNYDMKTPMQGDVFGNWDQMVTKMTQGFGAQFKFRQSSAGFIRQDTGGLKGPPFIMLSHTYMKPNKMAEYHDTFQEIAEHAKKNQPGIVAMIKANDGQDPNLVHTYYVAANSGVHD